MLNILFDAIDHKDLHTFSQLLTDDCTFRFGNMDCVGGRTAITAFIDQFFQSLQGLNHTLTQAWQTSDGMVCHGHVTYTRHDSTTLTVPFCNVLNSNDDGIYEYLIFADTSALF